MSKTIQNKIVRTDLQFIQQDLPALKNIQGTKVAYAVITLIDSFNKQVEAINEISKPPSTPEIVEYQEQVQALYDDMLIKNDKGEVLRDTNNKVRLKDTNLFNQETVKLLEERPVAKEQIEAHQAKYEAFMAEEVTLEYDSIVREDLPNDLNMTELKLLQRYWEVLVQAPSKGLQK